MSNLLDNYLGAKIARRIALEKYIAAERELDKKTEKLFQELFNLVSSDCQQLKIIKNFIPLLNLCESCKIKQNCRYYLVQGE